MTNEANKLLRAVFPPCLNLNQNSSPFPAPWTIALAANVRHARYIPSPAAPKFLAGLTSYRNRYKGFLCAKHALQSPSAQLSSAMTEFSMSQRVAAEPEGLRHDPATRERNHQGAAPGALRPEARQLERTLVSGP